MSRPITVTPTRRVTLGRLSEFGFTVNAVLTAEAAPGAVVLTLREDGLENYAELVRFARRNKMQILQVRKDGGGSFVELPSYLLSRAGFVPGNIFELFAEFGCIQLREPL